MLVTLGNTAGAAYIGVVSSAVLFGLSTLQTYVYYGRYPSDWKVHRISVGVLWSLDAIHLVLSVILGYHYLITNFGNALALGTIVWSLKAQIAVNVAIIVIVQSLYAFRMRKLARGHHHIAVPIIGIAFVTVACVTGIVLCFFMLKPSTFVDLDNEPWTIIASFATITATDLIIAGFMCFYLFKSRSGFVRTNSKLSTMMQYTLGSGLVTSACSMAALITYCISPHTLIFLAIEFSLTELYINSFLAMLNARRTINDRSEGGVSVSLKEMRSATAQATPADNTSGLDFTGSGPGHIQLVPVYGGNKRVFPWPEPEP